MQMPWQSRLQESALVFTCNDQNAVFNELRIDIAERKITVGPILPTLTAAQNLLTELNVTQPNINWLNDSDNISDQRIVIRNFTDEDLLRLGTIAEQNSMFLNLFNAVLTRTAPGPLARGNDPRGMLTRQDAMYLETQDSENRTYGNESAQLPLNESEQEILANVRKQYAAAYSSLGMTDGIIAGFKEFLKNYLTQNPMLNPRDGKTILPVEWSDLVKLNLDQDEELLQVYYQNPYHTALRYFMKPNHWISPEAKFVNRDAEGNAWSNFGADPAVQEIIALFWLAASDPAEQPVGTIDTRFRQNLFIQAIAGLTRGHNLDELQDRDDLKGDKPSCPGGVKQRLFNAVIEHSLFVNSIEKIITYDLGNLVRSYYAALFAEMNENDIKDLYDLTDKSSDQSCFLTPDFTNRLKELLRQINISAIAQKQMLSHISSAFNQPLANKRAKSLLELTPTPEGAHFMKLYKIFGLDDVLSREFNIRQAQRDSKLKRLH